ncbi:MAG: organomercurial lyase [Gemmatimonadota bacterium]
MNDLERAARWMVYQYFAQAGSAPSLAALARLLERPAGQVRLALAGLAAQHQIVLADDGETIRMAHPFGAFESGVRVEAGGTLYHTPCIWDALALPALLDKDAVIEVDAALRGAPLRLLIQGGGLRPTVSVIHFVVPAARFWDDIAFT